ncbi:MAG: hypothetical protein K2X55_12375 [Burkholderiaceae bacterium]|nr:hypothetical protein [Burkholderiaceae bacterium]
MNIEINGEGRVKFGTPQQKWFGEDSAMQTALFAGQEMIAITDDAGAFLLKYMGFDLGGFRTIEAAKEAGPAFARKVLGRLAEMIADYKEN